MEKVVFDIKKNLAYFSHCIETVPLICCVNRVTSFCIKATLA